MPSRFFNTTGPCRPDRHYMLPAAARLGALRSYIEREQYVVVYAARQSGKTTSLYALADELRREGNVIPVVLSCEVAGPLMTIDRAEPALLADWRVATMPLPSDAQPPPWPEGPPGARVRAGLAAWAHAARRPLVLLLDEMDALSGEVLVSLLRQLRAGFPSRSAWFPQSIALVGLRDVRDYLTAAGSRLGTASPFNIKVESVTLPDFTADETRALLAQHTEDTGQVFGPDAVERIFSATRGQPWLTNAVAGLVVEQVVAARDTPIGADHVDAAVDLLVRRRDTHLDSLAARAADPVVRSVLEPLLAGRPIEALPEDHRQFVVDLGLVRRSPEGGLQVANPIYENVLGRWLAAGPLDAMPRTPPAWLDADGRLVPDRLLAAFLAFWSANAEPLLRAAAYPEIAPHLVMMAFLDRVANGGGSVDREFAAGEGRVDLLLRYGSARLAFELKAWRDRQGDPLDDGLAQLDAYLDRLSLPTGWLVIFDQRRRKRSVGVRADCRVATTRSGREVTVIRA